MIDEMLNSPRTPAVFHFILWGRAVRLKILGNASIGSHSPRLNSISGHWTSFLFLPIGSRISKMLFKSSFKSATCLHEHENCPVCKSKKNCPYLYVFETPFPSDSAKKPEFLSPPQPFIISPPLDRTRNYDPGKNFTFEITLIGKAV